MRYTLRGASQNSHTGGGSPRSKNPWVRNACPTWSLVTMTSSSLLDFRIEEGHRDTPSLMDCSLFLAEVETHCSCQNAPASAHSSRSSTFACLLVYLFEGKGGSPNTASSEPRTLAQLNVDFVVESISGDDICQLTIDEQFKVLLQDGARINVQNTTLAGKLPPWFDQKKFKRGQQFFHQNYYALFVSKLSGLLTILVIPSILRVLVLTKQSGEPLTAFKRYLSTLSHMLDWYEGELLHSDSRASQSLLNVHSRHCAATHKANVIVYFLVLRASQSLLNVHSRHCAATHKANVIVYFLVLRASQSLLNVHSRHCAATHKANSVAVLAERAQSPLRSHAQGLIASQSLLNVHSRHCAATHKAQKAGLGPISQLDMSLTQFGFMGYGLLYPRKLGLAGNEDDFEGFIHFWRTIGHVLGIEERLVNNVAQLEE
uniref:ER-bound oxygenase mpaB/mpaB'/Rubber oxygenase catalytic domain-containing protein n=1 Tax=Timema monikensis TaxID=170555 RepID=A0A7R9HT87_9NEOP|nr:unnamed protein product [Timema monikensis]